MKPVRNHRGRIPAPHGTPDADKHCCHLPPGDDGNTTATHCPQPPVVEISSAEGSEDYTHACGDHAGGMVSGGDKVYRLKDGKEITAIRY